MTFPNEDEQRVKSEQLLPCPFCGGPAAMTHFRRGYVWIGCRNTQCAFPICISMPSSEAVDAWNSRPDLGQRAIIAAQAAMVERMTEALTIIANNAPPYPWQVADNALRGVE